MAEIVTGRRSHALHHVNVRASLDGDGRWRYRIDVLDPDGEWWEPVDGGGAGHATSEESMEAGFAAGIAAVEAERAPERVPVD